MTGKNSSFLKIHVEEERPEAALPSLAELPGVEQACRILSEVSGWSLQVEKLRSQTDGAWSQVIGDEHPVAAGRLALRETDAQPALPRDVAVQLSSSLGELISHLQQAHVTIWRREAELATAIPVSSRPDEAEHLAERLQAVLAAGAKFLQCDVAALYLLDDQTSELKLRASFGMPTSKLLEDARPLRGAIADLEALVGHAVALEDTSVLPQWKCPEEYPSAICVPVSTPTSPLGTLWFFSKQRREFGDQQTELAEIIAGRISSDLERDILLRQEAVRRLEQKKMRFASDWQADRLPDFPPLLDGWQIAGWTMQADSLGGDYHDWCVLADGCLAASIVDAQGTSIEAALTASAVHGALKALSPHSHSAKQMLNRVNDSLWTASCGDQFASLAYAHIHPETGEVEYANAGNTEIYQIRRRGYERLTSDSTSLGTQPDPIFRQKKTELRKGEMLLMVSEGVRQVASAQGRPALEAVLEHLCHEGAADTVDQLVSFIQVMLDSADVRPPSDRAVVLVRREK